MMENTELIKGLRWCADESICCDDFSGEKCPYFDEKKDSCSVDEILHDAADALEAAEQRIARLEEDLKTREAEREVLQDTIKICEEAADRYRAQLPKEAHWVAVHNGMGVCSNCNRQDSIDNMATHCRYCGARMTKGEEK